MPFVTEPERRTEIVADMDVLVVGGGTAGMTAAVAAARAGGRTMVIEKWGYVGGAAVGGLVLTVPEKAGIWGIEREFYEELQRRDAIAWVDGAVGTGRECILSAPMAKILGDEFIQSADVTPLYHTLFCDVLMDGDRIDAVLVDGKSGRQAIRAKVVVDCTGDADVAARAGAPYRLGHDDAGTMLEATTMYNAANVDIDAYRTKKPSREYGVRISGSVPTHVYPGELNCWGGSIAGDGTDTRELTRMEIGLRKMILEEFRNMRELIPGMADSFISLIAEQMGVRETRLIDADYIITSDDKQSARRFEDSIGQCWQFTVPYRSLLPRAVSNLIVAGRCIGATDANKIRIVPNCRTTGQAAGTAAAMAAGGSGVMREVDISELQRRLRDQNVCLGLE